MRLTCPNCGAQYEVPDDIIPTAGRDVQCSSCGNTWFQVHADMVGTDDTDEAAPLDAIQEDSAAQDDPSGAVAQDTPEFEEVEPPELSIESPSDEDDAFLDENENPDEMDLGGDDWDLEPEQDWIEAESDADQAPVQEPVKADPEPVEAAPTLQEDRPHFDDSPEPELADESDLAAEQDDQSPSSAPQSRGLDDSVKDILREEAEFEARARASDEPQSLETQGDLGLEDVTEEPIRTAITPPSEADTRLRRLRGEDDSRAQLASTAAAIAQTAPKDTRRDLLPDIEEINSTLRTSGESPRNPDLGQKTDVSARRSRGFRLGFSLVLLVAAGAVFVYSSHDSLSQSYPQAAPYIDRFMASANGTRLWLDGQVANLYLKLTALAG